MRAVVALGANLEEPRKAIELAIELLKQSTDVIAISSMYETAPVGGPEQDNYINAVVTLESELPAADLLALLHGIALLLTHGRIDQLLEQLPPSL